MTERRTIHLDGGKPLPVQEVFDGGGKIYYQDKPDGAEQPRKRITIHPPVETVTDGDSCDDSCKHFLESSDYAECKYFDKELLLGQAFYHNVYMRCQACIDAEKADSEKDALIAELVDALEHNRGCYTWNDDDEQALAHAKEASE